MSETVSLLDLVLIYPIKDNLEQSLAFDDLHNLSVTNTQVRTARRGSEQEKHDSSPTPSMKLQRPATMDNKRDEIYRKSCRSDSLLLCSEPHHVKGEKVRGCIMCGMPVCEACIIKLSFGRRQKNTFSNRVRPLCPECYDIGNVSRANLSKGTDTEDVPPDPKHQALECRCTAKEGHLCIRCKTEQESEAEQYRNNCYGEKCSGVKDGGFRRKVCLWCNLPLGREQSRARARREYDKMHLDARAHSTYERPSEAEMVSPATQAVVWDCPATQAAIWDSLQAPQAKTYDSIQRSPDVFEEDRHRELSEISERRKHTAQTFEEQRWERSESLRRSETFSPPPVIRRQKTSPVIDNTGWRDTDSTAPTLLEGNHWAASDSLDHASDDDGLIPEEKQKHAVGY